MIVCGLDVHKDTIFCAVHNGKKTGAVREYSTLSCSIRSMADDLKSAGVTRVAMESTGVYWIPVWNILEERGFELMLVNPYLIKQMPGRKSDVKDAQWIALLLRKGMLRGSLVPNEHIRSCVYMPGNIESFKAERPPLFRRWIVCWLCAISA